MFDFLIIGGGVAGLSAAARLAPLGKVVLLEAEDDLAYHASGRSAAVFEEQYGKPSTIALNRASKPYHEDADVLQPRGLMVIARKDQGDDFKRDTSTFSIPEISLDEASARVPILNRDTVAFAALSDSAMDIDTDRLIQGYVRTARASGAEIVTGARVSAIAEDGHWIVSTSKGDFEGSILVNAAGAWVDQVAGMAGVKSPGFSPRRRSVARLGAPGGQNVSSWPVVMGAGETWYAKPDAGALLVSPAEEHPMEPCDAYADDMVLAEGLARYEEMVTEPVTRPIANWAGLRTFAPDRTLVIGFATDNPSFFWLAGQGGYGMQSSPAASRLAADLIAGRAPELDADMVAALSPARFA